MKNTIIANLMTLEHLSKTMDNILEVIEETMAEAKMFLDEGLPASAELCLVKVHELQEQLHFYENCFDQLDEETHQLIEAEEEEELLPF